MLLVKRNTSMVVPFFMVDSFDHISPKTGLTPSVQISKAGGSFASAGGTVAEIGNGWYKITLSTTDTNTLGPLAFYITATGADPVSFSIQVVAFDPESHTNLGLSMIDTSISTRATDSSVWEYITGVGVSAVTLLERAYRTLTNKMKVNKVTGGVALYADDDTSIDAMSTITESDIEATRSKLTWR
jgi:hypothetical protein